MADRARRPDASRRRGQSGVSAVEFALVAPLAMLLLVSLVVGGLAISNQVGLTNAVRDGVRAAAVCGSNPTGTTQLPDGTACSDSNLAAYLARLASANRSGAAAPTVTVYDASHVAQGNLASLCQKGWSVEVSASYAQPLYLPLVGHWLGDAGGSTRTLTARAEATCEQ
jgi:Flp pilus assembly protein TadG